MFPSMSDNRRIGNKRSPERQKRRDRFIKIGLAVLAAAIVLVLLFFVIFPSYQPSKKQREMRMLPISPYYATQESLFFIQEGMLYSVDYANKVRWSDAITSEQMKVHASKDLVVTYSDTLVVGYSYNGQKTLTKEFTSKVISVRCGKTSTAILTENAQGSQKLYVIDVASGSILYDAGYEEKSIIDYDFYSENKLYVYWTNANYGTPMTHIDIFGSDMSQTGKISLRGQLLQRLIFLQEDILAVGTNHIMRMDYLGTLASEQLIYGWDYAAHYIEGENKPVFALVLGGGHSTDPYIRNAKIVRQGKGDVNLQLPSDSLYVTLAKDKLICFSSNKMYVYNLSGELKHSYELGMEAEKFYAMPDQKHVLLIGSETVKLLTLP